MGRLFTLLLFISVLLIFCVGGGIYWISSATVSNIKQEAANEIAQSISLNVSEQIHLLNKSLNTIAQKPEVIAALVSGNAVLITSVAENIEKYFPEALKIRLLPAGINKTDESSVPNMGFADLDMVRETFLKNQFPVVQGDIGPNRHLAMTSQIIQDNKVIGVILASLDYDFIARTIKAVELKNYYVELKQDSLVLGVSGSNLDNIEKNTADINIPRTTWKLHYEYPTAASLVQMLQFWGCIIGAILIVSMAFFFCHRRLSKLIKDDLNSVLKAFKDIMTHKSMGSYPVNLEEMNIVIASFLRLNRALIDSAGNIKQDDAELGKSDFFSIPDNFGFSEIPIETASPEKEQTASKTKATKAKSAEKPVNVNSTKNTAPTQIASNFKPESDFELEKFKIPEVTKASVETSPKNVLPTIFRADDIQGIVGETLTMNVAYDIGRAFGTTAKNHNCKVVVLGRDGLTTSAALSEELAKGIASTGCGVIDLGMVPTPVLYFAVQHVEGNTGIMVTGCHNLTNHNGFKMIVNGETLTANRIQDLKDCIDKRNYITDEMGLIEKNAKLSTEYVGTIAEDIRISRPMLIVLDCGNGVGGKLGPILLRTLGCEVIDLHCEINSSLSNHYPDPSKPENMMELTAAVKHYKADLGIAFDGDADRLGVVDSSGKIIWPDRQMMLFAKSVLSEKLGAEILYDVKCSKHLPGQIKKFGGRPVMWKSGHSSMKTKIRETGAKLAGEMSGRIFFNDRWFGFDDALYAAARLIEILSNETRSSAQIFAGFPDSINTPELTLQLPEGEAINLIENIRATADFADAKVIDIDGLRIEFPEAWGLICASTIASTVTLRFEADTQEAMQKIQQHFKQFITKANPYLDLPF